MPQQPQPPQSQQHQRRVRTQMTQYQVNVMRLIFAEYKTPTMNECEQMGREINLKKRVVQVWFQNARAKDKKSHPSTQQNPRSILFSNTANNDLSSYEFAADECLLCSVKYNASSSATTTAASANSASSPPNSQQQRDHLFSKLHLSKLIQFVTSIAVENGANPVELNSGKVFTGFHATTSAVPVTGSGGSSGSSTSGSSSGSNGSNGCGNRSLKKSFQEDDSDNNAVDYDENEDEDDDDCNEYDEDYDENDEDEEEETTHNLDESHNNQTWVIFLLRLNFSLLY